MRRRKRIITFSDHTLCVNCFPKRQPNKLPNLFVYTRPLYTLTHTTTTTVMHLALLSLLAIISITLNVCRAACIPCGKMMPICNCPEKSSCQFHPQTCDECAHFKCNDTVAVKIEHDQQGRKVHHGFGNRIRHPGQEDKMEDVAPCIICPLAVPSCEPCIKAGKKCAIIQQTCHRCALAQCY